MSATPAGVETPADSTPGPQAGTPGSTPQAGEPTIPEPMSVEKAKELRQEAQSLRTRLKALEKAEEDRQAAAKGAADLAAEANAEWQKLADERKARIAKLESDIATAKLDALRERIAAEYRIPSPWSSRIQGKDEAEMRADAKEMAKAVAPPKAGDTETGKGNGQGGGRTVEQIKDELRKSGRYASVG